MPRTPTALKLVTNTARASRLQPDEPTPPAAHVSTPPVHLTTEGAAAWSRLAKICSDMGTLTVADMPALERMAETAGELTRLAYEIAALGATVYETRGEGGGTMHRPYPQVGQRADAERRFLAYLSQFGLTPAARGKVSKAPAAGGDALDRFFAS